MQTDASKSDVTASWGDFWVSWGSFGRLLGVLGVVLGGLGALLGGPWGSLGRSWGDLGATFKAVQFSIDFLTDFGRPKGAKREAFWEPKGVKIGPKKSPKRRQFLISKKWPSKTVLEPSWPDFRRFGEPSWGPNLRSRTRGRVFGEKSRF